MYRQGKYTQKRGPASATKLFLKRRWKWWKALPRWKKIVYPSAPIVAFLIIIPVATYMYYYNYISDIDKLLNKNNTGVVMLDRNGKAFFSSFNAEHREQVKLKDISDDTEHALLAAEDKDFYHHGGFSLSGYGRALVGMVTSGSIQGGGSTLTLQLAKNTLLTGNQNFFRKYQELTIAVAIEQRYTKDQILEMYLNSVYYGENAFGIEEAAKNYFDKKPSELNLAESAMIVGVLPAPSAYSPISGNLEYAKSRQKYVLERMVADGYITQAQKDEALKAKLHYAKKKNALENGAPHFTEKVLEELYEKYGEEVVERSGYQVKTTLDLNLQKQANKAVKDNVANLQNNGGSNASLVAIDPKTGEVRAMVGSANYNNKKWGNVNMTTTPRQPGSTFKPIYYSAALADGTINPTTVLDDKPVNINGYQPKNYDLRYRGRVSVRNALNWSLNIPAVHVMQKYGIPESIAAAKELGITTLKKDPSEYGLSLAIGSAEVPSIEMANAYAAFGNSGTQYETSNIVSIEDKYGGTVFSNARKSHRAISEQGAYLISNVLSDRQAKQSFFGDSLTVYGTDGQPKNVAVKTGTTDDFKDAWTVGYTPDISVAVWTGNNDNTAMLRSGSELAAPIWRQFMGAAIGKNSPSFTQPAGITKATVCTDLGTKTDVFLSSKVPPGCEKKQEEKEPKKEEKTKCTVAGKENLDSDNPNCQEELCKIEGKETLAANDPNCKEDEVFDDDNDGVPNESDICPATLPNTEVDTEGCPVVNVPGSGNGGGNGNRNGNRS
ncbi:MAG TPA: PBP1A family penicillin-binding protein [Candidatus Saccharimonadales bacterium]